MTESQNQDQIKQALFDQSPLYISAGSSRKKWTPEPPTNFQPLIIKEHLGVVQYDPSELVITVKAGTTVYELTDTLSKHSQHLSFEPPIFSSSSTVGGMIASGFTGASRPWVGLLRDHLLGCKIINGKGEVLQLGGQVFKNVAGFDLFRPQAGAWGTLGVILEVSLRTNPIPQENSYFSLRATSQTAIDIMTQLQKRSLPISGLAWYDGTLHIRYQALSSSLAKTMTLKSLPVLKDNQTNVSFWDQLNNFNLPCFTKNNCLWKSVEAPANFVNANQPILINWGGATRWYTQIEEDQVQKATKNNELLEYWEMGKGVLKFNNNSVLYQLQQQIRESFDPQLLFNPHIQPF